VKCSLLLAASHPWATTPITLVVAGCSKAPAMVCLTTSLLLLLASNQHAWPNEEFVIPADVVSHLGNGSSEAGAKALYRMMDRVRQARTGTKKQGKQINPEKYLA